MKTTRLHRWWGSSSKTIFMSYLILNPETPTLLYGELNHSNNFSSTFFPVAISSPVTSHLTHLSNRASRGVNKSVGFGFRKATPWVFAGDHNCTSPIQSFNFYPNHITSPAPMWIIDYYDKFTVFLLSCYPILNYFSTSPSTSQYHNVKWALTNHWIYCWHHSCRVLVVDYCCDCMYTFTASTVVNFFFIYDSCSHPLCFIWISNILLSMGK